MNPGCTRRGVLAGLALPFVLPAGSARAESFPGRVTVAVAGPAGSALDRAGRSLAEGLTQHLPAGTVVDRTTLGGLDGVTGANDFAAQASLDGSAALLVPGAASLAWLAGDTRVHFNPARWLPILARTSPAFVVGRPGAIRPGGKLLVASGGAVSPALAAMLALDLLGADVRPVYGLGDDMAALAALRAGRVDAALLGGGARLAALRNLPGLAPLFTFGTPSQGGPYQRVAEAPTVPTLVEYGAAIGRAPPAGPRFDAWASAAGAVQLQYALVLPSLSPPSAVAAWRYAGTQALTPDLGNSFDVVYAAAAALLLRSLCPEAAALLALRSWLADRLAWQPG